MEKVINSNRLWSPTVYTPSRMIFTAKADEQHSRRSFFSWFKQISFHQQKPKNSYLIKFEALLSKKAVKDFCLVWGVPPQTCRVWAETMLQNLNLHQCKDRWGDLKVVKWGGLQQSLSPLFIYACMENQSDTELQLLWKARHTHTYQTLIKCIDISCFLTSQLEFTHWWVLCQHVVHHYVYLFVPSNWLSSCFAVIIWLTCNLHLCPLVSVNVNHILSCNSLFYVVSRCQGEQWVSA